MKKIELNVNGMPYSKRALTSDFKQNAFAKTYMNLFESLNYIEDGANTPQINSTEFEYGYALYPFNLNPGCCSDPGISAPELCTLPQRAAVPLYPAWVLR